MDKSAYMALPKSGMVGGGGTGGGAVYSGYSGGHGGTALRKAPADTGVKLAQEEYCLGGIDAGADEAYMPNLVKETQNDAPTPRRLDTSGPQKLATQSLYLAPSK